MKLENSADRLQTVKKLFSSALRVNDHLRKNRKNNLDFGDVLGLMAMMEKVTALEDLVRTEIIFENMLNDMFKLPSGERDKLTEILREQMSFFLKKILISRVEAIENFCDNNFSNSKLMKFQADLRGTMIALRQRYAEIYKI